MTWNRSLLAASSAMHLPALNSFPAPAKPLEQLELPQLLNSLSSEGVSAVLYHRTTRCKVVLPRGTRKFSPAHLTATERVREFLPIGSEIIVAQSSPGLLSIRLDHSGQGLFSGKIASLKLTRLQQYEPIFALGALETTPEFKSAGCRRSIGPNRRCLSSKAPP